MENDLKEMNLGNVTYLASATDGSTHQLLGISCCKQQLYQASSNKWNETTHDDERETHQKSN
jgi:hypothetical protein